MLTRKNPGNAAWTKVALAMALVGSFAVLGETGASANTAVTLYVNSSDSGSSCLDNSANACRTLQAVSYTHLDDRSREPGHLDR